MSLDLNLAPILQQSLTRLVGSVNGLIYLWQFNSKSDDTYICNPTTREYMILPRQQYCKEGYADIFYCFGVASFTREYKVMRIFPRRILPDSISTFQLCPSQAEVYTLGTGQWRSLGDVPYLTNECSGSFLNGHAHWTILDQDSSEKICAFDFDKETFGLFPSPPDAMEEFQTHSRTLGVLNGCLCQCDCYNTNLTVWVMKEYGIKDSWHIELVIRKSIYPDQNLLMLKPVHILEELKDGTILMASYHDKLFAYCPRSKAVVDTEQFDRVFKGLTYHPSFHRLQNFENERVHVF